MENRARDWAGPDLVSYADALGARHSSRVLSPTGGTRDELKERLRRPDPERGVGQRVCREMTSFSLLAEFRCYCNFLGVLCERFEETFRKRSRIPVSCSEILTIFAVELF